MFLYFCAYYYFRSRFYDPSPWFFFLEAQRFIAEKTVDDNSFVSSHVISDVFSICFQNCAESVSNSLLIFCWSINSIINDSQFYRCYPSCIFLIPWFSRRRTRSIIKNNQISTEKLDINEIRIRSPTFCRKNYMKFEIFESQSLLIIYSILS